MAFDFFFEVPNNWDLFEDLVCDLVRQEFKNPNFQRYGRQGQAQNGIDIFGVTGNGLIGIQCKNLTKKLTPKIVRDIIRDARNFSPTLTTLVIATTSSRDNKAFDACIEANQNPDNLFETTIWFWQDILAKMKDYPRLVVKHFGSEFNEKVNILHNSIFSIPLRSPIPWPFSQADLKDHCLATMGNPIKVTTPYTLSIGISGFSQSKYSIPRDIEIDLIDVVNEDNPPQAFGEIGHVFDELCSVIRSDFFDTQVIFDFNLHLSHAFLLGYKFRKVKNWNPVFIQGSMIWPSQGMELTYPGLRIHTPLYTGTDSTEIAIILGVRDITRKVIDSIYNWKQKPKVIYQFSRDSHIEDSSVPISLSYDFAKTINALIDEGNVSRIHLFLAIPKSLAALIAANLNRTCPISLYHLDKDRETYQLSGTIKME